MARNIRKVLNVAVIYGERRYFFFFKKSFEIHLYYTSGKKIILDYKVFDLSINKIGLDPIGMKLDEIIKFCDDNNYKLFLIERN